MRDDIFTRDHGIAVMDGNEMIIKGALEAGIALITGYPGSPVANVFDVIESHQELFREKGIKGIIANNENQSAALLHGAMSVPGIRAMTVFKSVGAYVALDGLAIANYTIPESGSAAICVAGDDPALSSTQVGADSRYTFHSAKIPVVEPSTNQEIKDWIDAAFRLAEVSQLLVGYIITTNQADGGGTVSLNANRYPTVNMHQKVLVDTSSIRLRERVSVPPNSAWLEGDIIHRRMPAFLAQLRRSGLNVVEDGADHRYSFITSGNAYNYLRHALYELEIDRRFPVLKLGCTYPLDPEMIAAFAEGNDEIIVIEEKRGFIETQVKEILRDAQQQNAGRFVPVWGKAFPLSLAGIPEEGALTPSILIDRIGRLMIAASGSHDEAHTDDHTEIAP
jgi:indolepyruvate ferredoxin oxidoreductase